MAEKVKHINPYVRVTTTSREIEYYSCRNEAIISFHPRNKYKMIKIIQMILAKNRWRESSRGWGLVTDTSKFGNVYANLIEVGLCDVDYFGNNWYKKDLEYVLNDLKLSSIPTDILKNKNIDKLKDMLKGMSLEELIYLHESGVINE